MTKQPTQFSTCGSGGDSLTPVDKGPGFVDFASNQSGNESGASLLSASTTTTSTSCCGTSFVGDDDNHRKNLTWWWSKNNGSNDSNKNHRQQRSSRNNENNCRTTATTTTTTTTDVTKPDHQEQQQQQQQEEDFISDSDIAKEMNALSVEERNEVYDDIHGCPSTKDEIRLEIFKLCKQMDTTISQMPAIQKKSYNKALLLCPTLKYDIVWKVMFLRADQYSPSKAARRLVKYYDMKHELWGDDLLVKRITLDDLTENDLHWNRIGFQNVLPIKDQAGRPIFFLDSTKLGSNLDDVNLNSMLRSWWYMTMSTLQFDSHSQKTGICFVTYYPESDLLSSSQSNNMRKVVPIVKRRGYMKSCLPCRISSTRVCYRDPKMHLLLGTIRMAMGKAGRLRLRTHYGSDLEHDYFLLTVGIPIRGLISGSRNNEKINFGHSFIKERRLIDQELDIKEFHEEQRTQIVICPKPNDVLIGRGVPYQHFKGNIQWNDLIYANLSRYSQSKQFEKTCISMEMVQTVQQKYNGRFLIRDPKANDNNIRGWTILSDSVAREKAASAFRTRLRPAAAGATTRS